MPIIEARIQKDPQSISETVIRKTPGYMHAPRSTVELSVRRTAVHRKMVVLKLGKNASKQFS